MSRENRGFEPGVRWLLQLLRQTVLTGAIVAAMLWPCQPGFAQELAMQHRQYLEAVQVELESMIATESEIAEMHVARRSLLDRGMSALASCDLPNDDVEGFEFSLAFHQGVQPFIIERSAYDEMVAQGLLSRLNNQEMRQRLSSLYAEIEVAQIRVGYFFSDLSRAGNIIWDHVEFSIAPAENGPTEEAPYMSPYETSVSYDFDALCSNRRFKNAYYEVFDSNEDRLVFGNYIADQTKIALSAVQAELSR